MSSIIKLIAIAVGLTVAGIGLALWLITRRRAWVRVGRALASPDPASRIAGLALLSGSSLRRYQGLLAWRVAEETDPDVLDQLARTIAEDRRTPLDRSGLVDLKLWAARRLLTHHPQNQDLLQSQVLRLHPPAHPTAHPGAGQAAEPAGHGHEGEHADS
jgi:hypothetical protein